MRPVFGSCALGLALSAGEVPCRAQAVNPDPSQEVQDVAAPSDPLYGKQKLIELAVDGSNQGLEVPMTMTIPTNDGRTFKIEINTGKSGAPSPASKPAPAAPDNTPLYIAVVSALFGFAVFMRMSANEKRAAPSAGAPDVGQLPFTIVKSIGEGGMGVVYEAIDRNLERRVAVKRLREGSEKLENREKLIREAKTVAALHHPNIVDIHAVVEQGGELYLVFEFVEGRTVDDVLKEKKVLSLSETRRIIEPICRALEFAHDRGIVHRDLKPANVMLTALGQVKVMDFGISRYMQVQDLAPGPDGETRDYAVTKHFSGTPLYLAPEAEFGVIRPEADVYALGVMTYRMLCGDYPYPPPVTTQQRLDRMFPKLSERVRGLPPAIDALIYEALHPDANQRLKTPREFRERLAAMTQ